MNFRGFKKVHEDGEKAVLQNQRGHKITLAIKQLSKSHRDNLQKLPLYKAGGGDVEDPTVDEQLAPLESSSPSGIPMMSAQDQAPAQSMSEAQAPEQEPTPAPQWSPQMARQEQTQQAPQPETEPLHPAQYAQKQANELHQEAANMSMDMLSGHIAPKRYRQMFDDHPTTLGKIGSLFGLILSGAGSGLAHQENMALHLMDKEIERDMEAQKENVKNKQNAYHYIMQNELNKANIKKVGAETQGALKDVEIKSDAHLKNMLQLGILNDLKNEIVNPMPQGPQRAQAEQLLGKMNSAVAMDIKQRNEKAAQTLTLDPEASFRKKQNLLRMSGVEGGESLARSNEERHVPGIGDGAVPVPANVRAELVSHQKLQDAAQDLLKYSKSHTNIIPNTPGYNQAKIKAEVLQQMIREGMLGTVFRESEKPLLKKFVDENPTGVFKMLSTQPKLKEILESNRLQGNALKNAYGLPSEKSQQQEKIYTSKSGKPYVIINGKPVYK